MSEGVKKEGVKGETLQIKVRDQSGDETVFKIKTSTKMSKVFDAYATRKGVDASQLRFFLDGERVNGDATPSDL
ncbi:Small ubiquitin-related modifier [Hondaea fermentalgiana]|uniref:Small ubiquitin-related modifier n=1 Tax=Hondaea fermentalgiana TaxID=2315210 RepID=A0A2R5GLZ8_9STRA|nr:Small ubiquitin-related modifier [Hondaea fermentalgiana]|eukprot:GBG28894.1 Small ubiquitin-related modifier [Hondaea fermentalgiana]